MVRPAAQEGREKRMCVGDDGNERDEFRVRVKGCVFELVTHLVPLVVYFRL